MNRRSLLGAAALGFSGCTGLMGGGGEQTPTDSGGSASGDLTAHVDGFEATVQFYCLSGGVRYFDEQDEQLATLEPENGLFATALLQVTNLGGVERNHPPVDSFSVRAGGSTHGPLTTLGAVDWEHLRPRSDAACELADGCGYGFTEECGTAHRSSYPFIAGGSAFVTLWFDVEEADQNTLIWEYDGDRDTIVLSIEYT